MTVYPRISLVFGRLCKLLLGISTCGILGCAQKPFCEVLPEQCRDEVGEESGSDPGDGDPSTDDGDGDPSTGDGDGGPSTGDGDGDPSTGDGDGDGDGDVDVDGDGDGDESCDLLPADIDFTLTGSAQQPGSCDDFVFTGQFENGDAIWNLDSCPCGAFCLIPDPYVLTLSVPNPDLLPTPIMCPRIEIRRDPDTCEPLSIVLSTVDEPDTPLWIGGREPAAPLSIGQLEVTPVNAMQCVDFDQLALEFTWEGQAITLSQGESGMLSDWAIENYASRESDDGDEYTYVMKR